MALRIDPNHVIRGELSNREKGRITGELWLCGRTEPVVISLEGNPHRDLAGRVLRFQNPHPWERPGHRIS